jgi:hypothetical protein
MESLMKTTVIGASGTKYLGQLVSLDEELGKAECIFVIVAYQAATREYATIYVGEAANLSDHVVNHPKRNCWRSHGATHLSVYRTHATPQRRQDIVKDILANYDFPCNEED